MSKIRTNWHTERLSRELLLVRWGDVGKPVLLFPTAGGDAEEIERFKMIHVLAPLIEAGRVSGCTRWQLFRHVQLPVALPEIMLGINQVVFLALSMDIIAAMVGTSDLGQEVFKALSKVDAGRGLILQSRVLHGRFLVRNRHAVAVDGKAIEPLEKTCHLAARHPERQVDAVHTQFLKSRIVDLRTQALRHRIADHAVDLGGTVDGVVLVDMLHLAK